MAYSFANLRKGGVWTSIWIKQEIFFILCPLLINSFSTAYPRIFATFAVKDICYAKIKSNRIEPPEIHKTALGAEETVDWEYFKDTPEAVDKLRQEGYTVCAVEQAEGSVMLDNLQLDKTKKYAIVMGNEVKGVQQNVVDNCDICIEIPQYGTKHSLNVSVTTGIVIWDFFKQLSD